jgi:hypothetical protein
MIKNSGKQRCNDGKQNQAKCTAALRYSNMQLNIGNKSEQDENMSRQSKCGENIVSFIQKPLC